MTEINKKKAVVIVHGIGEQESFDTLFDFYDGIYSFLRRALKWHGGSLKDEYERKAENEAEKERLRGMIARDLELDTKAHLLPRSVGLAKEASVDITYRDETVRVHEVWWAKDFAPPKLLGVYKWFFFSALLPFKKPPLGYLTGLFTLALFLIVTVVYVLIVLGYYLARITRRFKWISPLFAWMANFAEKGIINYAGDVEVYLNDQRQAERISRYLKERLKDLLNKDDISEVHIVGHSLGTVITYEVLCDMTEKAPPGFDKVRKYATAGSPLDKIRYFFGDKKRFSRKISPKIEWTNYYAAADLVTARLDYYKDAVKNVKVANRIPLPHSQYWKNTFVVKDIINKAFTYKVFQDYPVANKTLFGSIFCWAYMTVMFLMPLGVLCLMYFIYLYFAWGTGVK